MNINIYVSYNVLNSYDANTLLLYKLVTHIHHVYTKRPGVDSRLRPTR